MDYQVKTINKRYNLDVFGFYNPKYNEHFCKNYKTREK